MKTLGRSIVVVLLLSCVGTGARAASVVFEATIPYINSHTSSFSFSIPTTGEYWLRVVDHGETLAAVPRSLLASANVNQGLAVPIVEATLTQADPNSIKQRFNADVGLYNINVLGIAGSITFPGGVIVNPGQIGVQVSAVPLPPAAILFAGSLMALVAVGRRRKG